MNNLRDKHVHVSAYLKPSSSFGLKELNTVFFDR